MKPKSSFLLFLFFLLNLSNTFAQEIITIQSTQDLFLIGKSVSVLEDKEGKLSIQDILKKEKQQKFTPNQSNVFAHSPTNAVFWFKFTVQNLSEENIWFSTGSICSYVDFYHPDSLGNYHLVYQTGSLRPKNTRLMNTKASFWFPLSKAKDSTITTYYVRIKQNFPTILSLQIGTLQTLYEQKSITEQVTAAFFGAILIMVLYNLFLFFSIKDRIYLLYVAYLMSEGIASSYDYSIFEMFWSGEIIFWHKYFMSLVFTSLIFMVWFSIDYLNLRKNAKTIVVILIGILSLFFIAVVLNILGIFSSALTFNISQLFIQIIYLLCWGVAVYLLVFKKMKTALFYVLGWFFFVSAMVFVVLSINDIIPHNFSPQYMMYIGITGEIWFFSLALGTRFNLMKKEKEITQAENLKLVQEQNVMLEQRVEERTQEVEEQKEELLLNNEKLQQQEGQIRQLYNDLSDSIHYAQRIQQAILPTEEKFKKLLSESFVFFKPRDVVSGDFYFLENIENKIILASIDCTGHGVPGAFMSLIGNDILTEIVLGQKITEANKVLEKLHLGIRILLKQEKTKNPDGMDMSLVVIDKENKTLEFAGAKNSIIYIQNNELKAIKGDKMSIGGEQREQQRVFKKHNISIEKETSLYLFSDGIQDQFGGENNKKFTPKRLRSLLLENHQKPMQEQKKIITQTISTWQRQGNEEQIDDMLLIGVRI